MMSQHALRRRARRRASVLRAATPWLLLATACGGARTAPERAAAPAPASSSGTAASTSGDAGGGAQGTEGSPMEHDLAAAHTELGPGGLPVLRVPRASGAVHVDGRMDEPAWRSAGLTGPLVDASTGAAVAGHDARAVVRALWDEQYLYLGWEVADELVVDTSRARDEPLWEGDAVDLIVDPDGDGRDYYEVMVSPGEHTFDAFHLRPPTPPGRGDTSWNPDVQVGAGVLGTLSNPSDTDRGYVLEMAVRWRDITRGAPHIPPHPGDAWRGNLYLVDKTRSQATRFAAWSQLEGGSFHHTARFGTLVFE